MNGIRSIENCFGNGLSGLAYLGEGESRSISPENPTGEKGRGGMADKGTGERAARELGRGWKVSPSVTIASGEEKILGRIQGSGRIQHIWMVPIGSRWRHLILRFYWDGQDYPSIQVPLGDFFALGWGKYAHVNSLPVCVNPGRGFNCFWPMPFGREAVISLENRDDADETLYYQIDYTLCAISEKEGRFHATFRRSNPSPYKEDHVILDGVAGDGQYVGTYIAWGVNNSGWWGEGEVKFYLDNDEDFPTICGTGTEDYFLGAYNFDIGTPEEDVPNGYTEYSTPFAGLPQVIRPDGIYESQQRFGMYRWHIMDPVRFRKRIRITVQDLGWIPHLKEEDRRYFPQTSDIASTAFWYQTLPGTPLPPLPERDRLQVI